MEEFVRLFVKSISVFACCLISTISFAQPCVTYDTISAVSCNIYNGPSGVLYSVSGTYNDTIANTAGCDSIITISLEVFYDNNVTIYAATCGLPYVSDAGISYCCTGSYVENYTTVNGCDSIISIEVDIAEADGHPEFYINACDSWTSDEGNTYAISGVYVDIFVRSDGCDSLHFYYLTIDTINQSANWIGAMTIEANETGGAYQWIDCNNNNAEIIGATSKTFVASVNGDYACRVSKGACTKTTNCVRVQSLGYDETKNVFGIYPNPSNGIFSIELTSLEANTAVKITNVAGQIVYQSNLNNAKTDISIANLEVGLYFVTVANENAASIKSIVIE